VLGTSGNQGLSTRGVRGKLAGLKTTGLRQSLAVGVSDVAVLDAGVSDAGVADRGALTALGLDGGVLGFGRAVWPQDADNVMAASKMKDVWKCRIRILDIFAHFRTSASVEGKW
jgi:hypothetical protein